MNRYKYPSLDQYIAQERATIRYLMTQSAIRKYDAFAGQLSGLYDKLKGKFNRNIIWDFEFKSDLEKQRKTHAVRLSGKVEFDTDRLTFSSHNITIFGVVDTEFQSKVIRQLHFDVALPWEKNKALHPLYHIQSEGAYDVGGKDDVAEESCHVSLPRIPFYPLSFALFFDMSIRELGSKDLKTMIDVGGWREIIRANEDKMIYPFWDEVMHRKNTRGTFIIPDIYYEPGDQA